MKGQGWGYGPNKYTLTLTEGGRSGGRVHWPN